MFSNSIIFNIGIITCPNKHWTLFCSRSAFLWLFLLHISAIMLILCHFLDPSKFRSKISFVIIELLRLSIFFIYTNRTSITAAYNFMRFGLKIVIAIIALKPIFDVRTFENLSRICDISITPFF